MRCRGLRYTAAQPQASCTAPAPSERLAPCLRDVTWYAFELFQGRALTAGLWALLPHFSSHSGGAAFLV